MFVKVCFIFDDVVKNFDEYDSEANSSFFRCSDCR